MKVVKEKELEAAFERIRAECGQFVTRRFTGQADLQELASTLRRVLVGVGPWETDNDFVDHLDIHVHVQRGCRPTRPTKTPPLVLVVLLSPVSEAGRLQLHHCTQNAGIEVFEMTPEATAEKSPKDEVRERIDRIAAHTISRLMPIQVPVDVTMRGVWLGSIAQMIALNLLREMPTVFGGTKVFDHYMTLCTFDDKEARLRFVIMPKDATGAGLLGVELGKLAKVVEHFETVVGP